MIVASGAGGAGAGGACAGRGGTPGGGNGAGSLCDAAAGGAGGGGDFGSGTAGGNSVDVGGAGGGGGGGYFGGAGGVGAPSGGFAGGGGGGGTNYVGGVTNSTQGTASVATPSLTITYNETAVASLSPAGDHDFGSQTNGTTSPDSPYTLSNVGEMVLNISAIGVGGSTEFEQSNNCGATLAPGASCTINTRFDPETAGAQSATLTVNTDGGNATRALSGFSAVPVATLTPADAHDFGNQRVGTTSADFDYTLENTGDGPLSVAVGVGGSTEFEQSNNCGATLAPGATCTINTRFDPETAGAQSATLTVNTDGGNRTRALSGFGTAPVATLAPAGDHDFGEQISGTTSPDFDYTLQNTGDATLDVSAIGLNGGDPGQFGQTNDCGATLAPSASCTIHTRFAPTSSGSKSTVMEVNTDGGNATRALSGSAGTPVATLTPTSGHSFGTQFVGTISGDWDYVLENTGDISLSVSIGLTGSTDFQQDNDCGAALAPGAECTIHTRLALSSAGSKSGTLAVDTNGGNLTRALSGAGIGSFPPTAVDDSATINEDAGATRIDVRANDTDPDGGTKTIQARTNGSHGAVAITNSGDDLTYTPAADYCNTDASGPGSGPDDTFSYTLNGDSTAIVSVEVTCVDEPVTPGPTDPDPDGGSGSGGDGGSGDGGIGSGGGLLPQATPGPDALTGTALADLIDGLAGDDLISGGLGDDRLIGGDGDDLIRGGKGADRLDGGEGKDRVFGNDGRDKITADDGEKDRINCGGNVDAVIADARDDVARSCEKIR